MTKQQLIFQAYQNSFRHLAGNPGDRLSSAELASAKRFQLAFRLRRPQQNAELATKRFKKKLEFSLNQANSILGVLCDTLR